MFGIALGFVGYALFYWGLHHFPAFHRYSLYTLLGLGNLLPSNGTQLQLGKGGGVQGGPQGGANG
jgi:hypothetical protein